MFMFCGIDSCERENEGFVKYFWLSGEDQSICRFGILLQLFRLFVETFYWQYNLMSISTFNIIITFAKFLKSSQTSLSNH